MKEKMKDKFKNVNMDSIKNMDKEKVKGLFNFRTDTSAPEVQTVCGKLIGGVNTNIGTKINKLAKFFEILYVISMIISLIAAVVGVAITIFGIFSVISGNGWIVAVGLLTILGGLLLFGLSILESTITWTLYGYGQMVNDLSAIRKSVENGAVVAGGENVPAVEVSVSNNPDELPEL